MKRLGLFFCLFFLYSIGSAQLVIQVTKGLNYVSMPTFNAFLENYQSTIGVTAKTYNPMYNCLGINADLRIDRLVYGIGFLSGKGETFSVEGNSGTRNFKNNWYGGTFKFGILSESEKSTTGIMINCFNSGIQSSYTYPNGFTSWGSDKDLNGVFNGMYLEAGLFYDRHFPIGKTFAIKTGIQLNKFVLPFNNKYDNYLRAISINSGIEELPVDYKSYISGNSYDYTGEFVKPKGFRIGFDLGLQILLK